MITITHELCGFFKPSHILVSPYLFLGDITLWHFTNSETIQSLKNEAEWGVWHIKYK